MASTYVRETCGRLLHAQKPSLVQESPQIQKAEGWERLRGGPRMFILFFRHLPLTISGNRILG